jgi:hypothetical protein
MGGAGWWVQTSALILQHFLSVGDSQNGFFTSYYFKKLEVGG